MILRTSNTLNETADQVWRFRRIVASIFGALAAARRRERLLAYYATLAPETLRDIGVNLDQVRKAYRRGKLSTFLSRRYDIERAWDARTGRDKH